MNSTTTRRTAISAAAAGILGARIVSARTPAADTTRRYIGHDARITAEIPADWAPYMGAPDLMLSMRTGGFVMSYADAGESLEAVSQAYVDEMQGTEPAPLTIDGASAMRITGTSPVIGMPATRLVVTYPTPFPRWGETKRFAVIDIAPDHAEQILPTISLDMSQVTPAEYGLSIIDMAEANAIVTAQLDWDALRTQAESAGADMEHMHAFLSGPFRDAFKATGDKHTHFAPPDDETASATPEPALLPTASVLDDGSLHLTIPDADGGVQQAYMEAGRTALADYAESARCGVIIDLRANGGGAVFPMVASISPLLPAGNTFGFAYPQMPKPYMMTMENILTQAGATSDLPGSDLDLTGMPVAVLFGPDTASSGELTAISFIGREGARSFGMDSAGYTTSNNTYFLLDGWIFNLATSLMTDREGNAFGGVLTPDVEVPFTADQIGTSEDPVIAAAQSWLAEQPCPPAATPVS